MQEYLQEAFLKEAKLPVEVLILRLGLAFVLGCAVAFIHRFTARRSNDEEVTLSCTLVLLAILIAMVTQVVGENQARAFSLVGALAIVRFRTVVEDTRDTGFVIFAVVEGMAAGAAQLPVALVGLGIGGLAAFLFRANRVQSLEAAADFTLTIRVSLKQGMEGAFQPIFEAHLDRFELTATSTARSGAALEMAWRVRLKPGVGPLSVVAALNQVEGVQGVDLQRR